MKKLFNLTNILIFIIIITLIIGTSLFIYTKNNNTNLKILIENNTYCSGMPGPNGGNNWGNSVFITNNGRIHQYKYDEYEDIDSYYPQKDSLTDLSTFLITSAKKTITKISNKELSLLNYYINELKNESLEEKNNLDNTYCLQPEDATCYHSLNIFDYNSNNKININTEECGTYYTSPSIEKILEIINKYL